MALAVFLGKGPIGMALAVFLGKGPIGMALAAKAEEANMAVARTRAEILTERESMNVSPMERNELAEKD